MHKIYARPFKHGSLLENDVRIFEVSFKELRFITI